jgi:demethylmenaquinone methyltransferase/2-methoxy-6-polyprenyl-1,4-benzoquinol methylase
LTDVFAASRRQQMRSLERRGLTIDSPSVNPTTVLPDPRPTRDKDAALVQAMFDRVAPRYDLANSVLSLGQDRHWRRVACLAAEVSVGDLAVDVAAGTGKLALELRAAGATVVALDFSENMVITGAAADRAAFGGPQLLWVNGDALHLPLADASVDALTISFGLRNLPDVDAGLAEFARVLRPAGRLVVCEFSTPINAWFRALYRRYLVAAIPALAKLVTSDPAAYQYLADSILAWPDQHALARQFRDAGFKAVRYKNLSGGIVAVHQALR